MKNEPNPENPWMTHSSEVKYDNPWIRVTESQVTNPSGNPGIYGVVHYKNLAVGVVPVDAEDHTWLVGQYRYATDTYEWEIPAGGGPPGEDPLETAKRELQEETGLTAGTWEKIADGLQLSNSISDERCCLFAATDLTRGEAAPEDTEDLALRRLPLSEAIEMVLRGEIRDSVTVLALLKLAALRDR